MSFHRGEKTRYGGERLQTGWLREKVSGRRCSTLILAVVWRSQAASTQPNNAESVRFTEKNYTNSEVFRNRHPRLIERHKTKTSLGYSFEWVLQIISRCWGRLGASTQRQGAAASTGTLWQGTGLRAWLPPQRNCSRAETLQGEKVELR